MAFGQPFYNYEANSYGSQNNAYMAQQPQYANLYGQPQNIPQNANNGGVQQFQGQAQQQTPQMTPRTNISPVASLMDAMSRLSEPNTNMYYADQDQPFIYQISIDMQGRKTYKTFKIEDVTEQASKQSNESVTHNLDLSDYAKKEDLQALKDEILSIANTFVAQQFAQSAQSSAKAKSIEKIKADKE